MGSKIIQRLTATVILCAITIPLMAQEFDWEDPRINWNWDNNRHTVTIHAGYNSIQGILSQKFITKILDRANTETNTNYNITNTPYGYYGIQYHYNINKWCRTGMKFSADINRMTINDNTQFVSYLNLLASAQFTYYNENKWRVYSGADAGLCILLLPHINSTKVLPAVNITPLGFSYGRGFIVFAEINLGSDAVIKGGFGLRL